MKDSAYNTEEFDRLVSRLATEFSASDDEFKVDSLGLQKQILSATEGMTQSRKVESALSSKAPFLLRCQSWVSLNRATVASVFLVSTISILMVSVDWRLSSQAMHVDDADLTFQELWLEEDDLLFLGSPSGEI